MRRLGTILASAMLLGCSKDSTSPNSGGSAFDISVSGGVNPTYTWEGGGAHSVSVVRTSAPGDIVWGVAQPLTGVASPVTHGSLPGGALQSSNKEPTLTAGVTYRVSVTLVSHQTGWKEFTP